MGRFKKILIDDTLIEQHSVEEIKAVVRHELGHWVSNHAYWTLLFRAGEMSLMCALLQLCVNNRTILSSFGFHEQSLFISLILFLQLYDILAWVMNIGQNKLERKFEFEADLYSAQRDSASLRASLIRATISNSSNLVPDPWYAILKHTHPILPERLAAIALPIEPSNSQNDQ